MSDAVESQGCEAASASEQQPSMSMRMILKTVGMKFPSVCNIDTDTLQTMRQQEAESYVVLDNRPENEYIVSHIEGSVRSAHDEDMSEVLSKIKKDQDTLPDKIICYCSLGYRSCMMAERIQKHLDSEYQNEKPNCSVVNLEGGLFKWANEDRPMVNVNGKLTKFAHPYNFVFGRILDKNRRRDTPED